jgi:hypothetical protein
MKLTAPLLIAKVKEGWSCTSISFIRLYDVQSGNFICICCLLMCSACKSKCCPNLIGAV